MVSSGVGGKELRECHEGAVCAACGADQAVSEDLSSQKWVGGHGREIGRKEKKACVRNRTGVRNCRNPAVFSGRLQEDSRIPPPIPLAFHCETTTIRGTQMGDVMRVGL